MLTVTMKADGSVQLELVCMISVENKCLDGLLQ
jgi:hypothetical protein